MATTLPWVRVTWWCLDPRLAISPSTSSTDEPPRTAITIAMTTATAATRELPRVVVQMVLVPMMRRWARGLPQSSYNNWVLLGCPMTSTSNHCLIPQASAVLTCSVHPGQKGCVEERANHCSMSTKPSTQEARRCACSVFAWGRRYVARRQAVGGATTTHVLQQRGHTRTGSRDTRFVPDIHLQFRLCVCCVPMWVMSATS